MLKRSSKRPLAELLTALAVLLFVSGCAAIKVPEGAPDGWTTHMHDGERSNRTGASFSMPMKNAWSRKIAPFKFYNTYPKWQLSSPSITDGALYVGSTDTSLYKFNARTGRVLWRYDAGDTIETPPTVAGGSVCIGSGNGVLKCLDSATGKELYTYQARSEIIASPLAAGERLFVYSSDDRLHALDIETGEKLWTYTRGTYRAIAIRNTASPARGVSASGSERVCQFFTDGSLVCFEPDSGQIAWERPVVSDPVSAPRTRRTPLVNGTSVFIIDGSGSVVGYDLEDGSPKGIYRLEKAVDFVFSAPDTLVIAGSDSMTALDIAENRILWKKKVEFGPVEDILASSGHIFITSNYESAPFGINMFRKTRGRVQAVRAEDGAQTWNAKLKSTVAADPAAAPGLLAVFVNKGRLRVYTSR